MLITRPKLAAAAVLLASSLFDNAAAQVSTSCQPLNTTNCPPDPAFGMDYTFSFNMTPNAAAWEKVESAGTIEYDPTNGAAFTIAQSGDSPTLRTQFYYFFGRTEIVMKTAPGQGIISSVMMLSDDLDEIDWEFLGGNDSYVETNYFGKGQPLFTNALYYPVNGGAQGDYHNYTSVWTNTSLEFFIDGALVRTLLPAQANNSLLYPQTPMRLSIGTWAAGDTNLNAPGTVEWAGGPTDFSKGPFVMYVKSVRVTDYNSGSEYTYTDHSGSWESIKITGGNSTTLNAILNPPQPAETIAQKWNNLSPTVKTAIYASAAGVVAIFLAWALIFCIRQRRRGAREAAAAEAKWEADRVELDRFKKAGINPDSLAVQQTEYDPKELSREGVTGANGYSVPEKLRDSWDTYDAANGARDGAGAVAGGAAADPLLRDGPASPHSPTGTYGDRMNSSNMSPRSPREGMPSPSPLVNPMRSPTQQSPPTRSFTSPNTQMRVASPGPAQGGFGGPLDRMASPAPMQQPQPQRSFTTGPSGYSAPPQQGDDGYWGNGGYR